MIAVVVARLARYCMNLLHGTRATRADTLGPEACRIDNSIL